MRANTRLAVYLRTIKRLVKTVARSWLANITEKCSRRRITLRRRAGLLQLSITTEGCGELSLQVTEEKEKKITQSLKNE
jgi:hypothetical protein